MEFSLAGLRLLLGDSAIKGGESVGPPGGSWMTVISCHPGGMVPMVVPMAAGTGRSMGFAEEATPN